MNIIINKSIQLSIENKKDFSILLNDILNNFENIKSISFDIETYDMAFNKTYLNLEKQERIDVNSLQYKKLMDILSKNNKI
ncbi:MAG: hypothetical protein IKU01_05215 [Bacteroidales bacterium]|nr:hypothetical protein [Bacteroidales bacterium]